MSSDEEFVESTISAGGSEELIFLATHLHENADALDKSHLPDAKKKKDAALRALCKLYENNFGKVITTKCLLKKINNMKTRLKKKTDRTTTGNKPIHLKEWEKKLYDIIDGDKNPTIQKTPGAVSVGADTSDEETDMDQSFVTKKRRYNEMNTSSSTHIGEAQIHKKPTTSNARNVAKYETEETRKLTNSELQRLVLLEQLATARAQKDAARAQEAFYKKQIEENNNTLQIVDYVLQE